VALAEDLGGTFHADGFDLSAALTAGANVLGAIAPAVPTLDLASIAAVARTLANGDFSSIGGAVSTVAEAAAGEIRHLPGAASALAPALAAINALESFTTGQAGALIRSAQASSAGVSQPATLSTVVNELLAVARLAETPGGQALSQIVTLVAPGAAEGLAVAKGVASRAPAVVSTLQVLGALGAVHASATRLQLAANTAASQLDPAALTQTLASLANAGAAGGLAQRIATTDTADSNAVQATVEAVRSFATSVKSIVVDTPAALAVADAALGHFDAATIAGELATARNLVRTADFAPIRAAALALRHGAAPFLALDPGTPAASAAAFGAEVTAFGHRLADAVNQANLDAIVSPILSGLSAADQLTHTLSDAVAAATAALRGALEQVKNVVTSIDTASIGQQLQRFLQPLVAALLQLQVLLAAAMDSLRNVVSGASGLIHSAETELTTVVSAIEKAFGAVRDALHALNLKALVDDIRPTLNSTVSELQKCQLEPYFSTAVQVMDGARTVVSALPLSLLPDDQKQKLDQVTGPIKAIDFASEVRDPLEQELEAIKTSLNQDVLGTIDQAFQQVVTFLQGIDPRGPIQDFETAHFDPVLARLAAVDPDELLAPVTEALVPVRSALTRFDPVALLAPVDQVFDEMLAQFDALAPSTLLAEPIARVTAARSALKDLIRLDAWAGALDRANDALAGALDQLDADRVLSAIGGMLDELLAGSAGPGGPSVFLAPAVFQILSPSGLTLRMDSLAAAISWVRGADGPAAVRGVVSAAHARLELARAAANAFDPVQLGTVLVPAFTSVKSAVEALPNAEFRAQLQSLLAGLSPLDQLGPLAALRDAYRTKLDDASAVITDLVSAGMSEVKVAAQGLRSALNPLVALQEQALKLLHRIGISENGLDLRALISALRAALSAAFPSAALTPLLDAIRAKLSDTIGRIVERAKQASSDLSAAIDAFDLSVIATDLGAIHAQIRADLAGAKPSVLLAGLIAAVDSLKSGLATLDPLAAIRPLLDEFHQLVSVLDQQLRPTKLLANAIGAYEDILTQVEGLDVSNLLAPVIDELSAIDGQLETGLNQASNALIQLQQALP